MKFHCVVVHDILFDVCNVTVRFCGTVIKAYILIPLSYTCTSTVWVFC